MGSKRSSGSIPAWAGETRPGLSARSRKWVYPRVGGGNAGAEQPTAVAEGLSPRGRGKHPGHAVRAAGQRSIPAWAGETPPFRYEYTPARVYPRVGGGNTTDTLRYLAMAGLSPRGRGKLQEQVTAGIPQGSIPAWAGETTPPRLPGSSAGVYPRVGGGNGAVHAPPTAVEGLSPRGRGKRSRPRPADGGGGSIPAWAGETPPPRRLRPTSLVYPRVGGGNPAFGWYQPPLGGLSPRGRGKRLASDNPGHPRGSIPAWAGETGGLSRCQTRATVYPRVGGGNLLASWC